MLPNLDPGGRKTFLAIMTFSVILLPVSLLPVFLGLSGAIYSVGAILLGIMILFSATSLVVHKSFEHAKKLFKATVYYLPILLILILCDMWF